MRPWSLLKIRAFIFYAVRSLNIASTPRWWPKAPDIAGVVPLSMIQTFIALAAICSACGKLGFPVTRHAFGALFLVTYSVSHLYNYLTLVRRGQWRHFKPEFDAKMIDDDLPFAGIGVLILMAICATTLGLVIP